MRIAQVCPFYFPKIGGVEEVVKAYSERLSKRDHKISVYTSGSKDEIVNGVKLVRSRLLPSGVYSLMPAFPFRLCNAQTDLIHLHANKRFSTDFGAFLAKLKRIPFVFSPHAGTFGRTVLGKVHNKTIGRLALAADIVLCVSNFEKSLIEKAGVKVKRFEVLPNGVDLSEFDKVKHNVYEKFNIAGRPVVLFVGRLARHKGLDVLLKAIPGILKKYPKAVFFIVGPDGGEERNLKFKIENLKLERNVILAGELEREDLVSAYRYATVFCLPSCSEAFGLVLVEAMAAGLPVVTTNLPSILEIVKDGEVGFLIKVDDKEALEERILRLLGDENLREEFSQNAKKEVAEKYNWEKIIDRLEKLYIGVLR